MRRLWILFFLVCFGCAREAKPKVEYPSRLPIFEQAQGLTVMPEYLLADNEGGIVGVSKGDVAEFDGLLFSEEKALAVGELRIAYDEVYRLAITDRKYFLSVIEIQERELYRGDQVIQEKENQLKKIRDSWWERNKVSVGITIGIISGVALSLATGKVWSMIEEKN